MIDAQAVEHAFAHPLEYASMCVLEDLFVFHTQPDEGGDVEEAPVAEVAVCAPPPRQPIVLHVEQGVQRVGVGVHVRDGLIEGRRRERILIKEPAQLFAQHGLVAMSASHAGAIGRRRPGEPAEGVCQERERV